MDKKNKVWFVGAGPGAPELITLKGEELLNHADIVIYAGSLVNKELLEYCKPDCKIYDSASMTLEEVITAMEGGVLAGKLVVRLHTGDPSLYGAIYEQFVALDKLGIGYEVVPGVSSAFAAAASLKREFTLPGISQTVIFTRITGRTPVPEKEALASLSKHRASMVIFLSVSKIDEVVASLKEGYEEDTPVCVLYKASWDDEKTVKGTLGDIAGKVKGEGVTKTALILVGEFLDPKDFSLSRLYADDFEHGYRKAGKETEDEKMRR